MAYDERLARSTNKHFEVGDTVVQVTSGYSTTAEDNGKTAVVSKITGDCITFEDKGWKLRSGERTDKGFDLVKKREFQVGDEVELVDNYGMGAKKGAKATVVGFEEFSRMFMLEVKWRKGLAQGQGDGGYEAYKFKLTTKGDQSTMNKTIAKLFKNTEDAMLVNKYFQDQVPDNHISYITINGHQDELLKKAKEIDAERNKNS